MNYFMIANAFLNLGASIVYFTEGSTKLGILAMIYMGSSFVLGVMK